MARKAWTACVLLLATVFAGDAAANAADVRETIEASMLVTGTIEVDPEGKVERFELDAPEKLPASVQRLLGEAVPAWRFEPFVVGGQPAAVRTPMRIRVAANKVPDTPDSFALRVAGASFGETEEGGLRSGKLRPPAYPREPLNRGVQGTVYLLVKVGRTGDVEDVIGEQVNLQFGGSDRFMRRMRTALERAAISAAREWTFIPPTAGDDVDAPFWTARVPVEFSLRKSETGYGQWSTYVPGPRTLPPWEFVDSASGADSFAASEIYTVGKGLKLLTPLAADG